MADGVPLPTATWKKPDASSFKSLKAKEIMVDLLLQDDTYFGNYTCEAKNDMGGDARTIEVKQLSKYHGHEYLVRLTPTSLIR